MKTNPKIFAIAGIPASGKTSFRVEATQQGLIPQVYVHDCDAVMQQMPEYQSDLCNLGPVQAFEAWELPARELANQQLDDEIQQRNDVIYDRSCALPESFDFLQELTKSGYKLIMYFIFVDLEQALQRAELREINTGRHIPPRTITERWQMLRSLWPKYLDLASEIYLIDGQSETYNIFAQYLDKELTVHDPEIYSNFVIDMGDYLNRK